MFNKLRTILSPGRAREGAPPGGVRVLVVDDDETHCRLMEKTLAGGGYQVLLARNGREGLEVIRRERPHLILTDCDMPEMSGIEMCQHLKEDAELKDIPVIFLTGSRSPQSVIDCFGVEADNFLSKPINPKLLLTQVKETLEEYYPSS